MRELYMKQGHGFLLVFSICNMNSFYELAELREQIIRIKDDEDIPLVVVGNKSDMEDDRVVQRAQAFQMAQQWGQKPYYETSARRRTNVEEVFMNLTAQIVRKDSSTTANQSSAQQSQSASRHRERSSRPERRARRTRRRDQCVIL
jgi:GTPase SAR1 family protein